TVSNPSAGYVANFIVEGDIAVQGGKITLADGETIDAETADVLTLRSDGDIAFVLGDNQGNNKLVVYDSTGTREVFSVDSSGGSGQTGGVTITGTFTLTGDFLATGDTTLTGDLTVNGDTTLNGDTTANGQLGVNNYADLSTIQALTQ
ncbi:hypothetical protein CO180_03860, partial [candidate division WWE3 bacterium CG_4_9_14_3_um_filter_41_6]